MKYGGVKLALWTETSHLGEMMQSCKCFQNVSKMSTLTYNLANSIILMNAMILNIIHNIFNIGTGYDYPDLPELGNNNEQLGLPERLSTGIQFRLRNLFHGKNRVIVILFVIITWSYYYPEKTKLVKQKKQPNGPVQSVNLMFIFMHP
jgi:hypothetical protein